jgi:hypothetical protein
MKSVSVPRADDKRLYHPPADPVMIDVPEFEFVMIDGSGDPNTSSSRRVGSSITPGQSSEGAPDMTSRTSIHSYSGSPPGPGSAET